MCILKISPLSINKINSQCLHFLHQDSEDGSALQLTPEQQKQLEMIERMPVIREVELSAEDWASKTPEEREKILGIYHLYKICFLYCRLRNFVCSF